MQVAVQLRKVKGSNDESKLYGAQVYDRLQVGTNKLQVITELTNVHCSVAAQGGLLPAQWMLRRSMSPNSNH